MNTISASNYKKFIRTKPKTDVKSKLLECYYNLASAFLKKVAAVLLPHRSRVDYKIYLKNDEDPPYKKLYPLS